MAPAIPHAGEGHLKLAGVGEERPAAVPPAQQQYPGAPQSEDAGDGGGGAQAAAERRGQGDQSHQGQVLLAAEQGQQSGQGDPVPACIEQPGGQQSEHRYRRDDIGEIVQQR